MDGIAQRVSGPGQGSGEAPPARPPAAPGLRVQALLASAAIASFTLVAAHAAFTPAYQTNDDPGMDLIAAGVGYTDRPSPFLMYVHVLVGWALSALYRAAPGVPWYRVLMLAVQYAASVVTYDAVLRGGFTARKVALVALHAAAFDLYFYLNPQFTVTSTLAAQAAVVLWLSGTWRGGRLSAGGLALFLAFFAVSAMIRAEACGLIMLLAVPAVVVRFGRPWSAAGPAPGGLAGRARSAFEAACLPFALAAALAVALASVNEFAYSRSAGWDEFHRYNRAKSWLIDFETFGYDGGTRWIFDRVGWSRNDFMMFSTWAFTEPRLYSLGRLETVVSLFRRSPPRRPPAPPGTGSGRPWSLLSGMVGMFVGDDYYGYLRFAAMALPLVFLPPRRGRWVMVAASFVGCLVCIAYLNHGLGRCPPRVSHPLFSYFSILAVFFADPGPSPRTRYGPFSALRFAGYVVATTVLFTGSFVEMEGESALRSRITQGYRKALRKLGPRPDRLYVNWSGSLRPELLPPTGLVEGLRGFKIFSFGSGSRIPLAYESLRAFQITDIYRAMYLRPDVYVIAEPFKIDILKTYAKEHYDDHVIVLSRTDFFAPMKRGKGHHLFTVFKLSRASP